MPDGHLLSRLFNNIQSLVEVINRYRPCSVHGKSGIHFGRKIQHPENHITRRGLLEERLICTRNGSKMLQRPTRIALEPETPCHANGNLGPRIRHAVQSTNKALQFLNSGYKINPVHTFTPEDGPKLPHTSQTADGTALHKWHMILNITHPAYIRRTHQLWIFTS